MLEKLPPPSAGTPSPRRVPEPFLRAEIAAFPLASEESFREGLVELDPRLADGGKTVKLWRACEGRLAPHTGWSLDRLVAARDRGWFGQSPRPEGEPMPMHDYRKRSAPPPLRTHDHSRFLSGNNSSMRLLGQEGSFSRVSISQAMGSMPFRRAVSSSD